MIDHLIRSHSPWPPDTGLDSSLGGNKTWFGSLHWVGLSLAWRQWRQDTEFRSALELLGCLKSTCKWDRSIRCWDWMRHRIWNRDGGECWDAWKTSRLRRRWNWSCSTGCYWTKAMGSSKRCRRWGDHATMIQTFSKGCGWAWCNDFRRNSGSWHGCWCGKSLDFIHASCLNRNLLGCG